MNQQETLKAITKLNSIDAQLRELYRELHRQEEFTLSEAGAIERLEYVRAELAICTSMIRRQHTKFLEG